MKNVEYSFVHVIVKLLTHSMTEVGILISVNRVAFKEFKLYTIIQTETDFSQIYQQRYVISAAQAVRSKELKF